MPEHSTSPPGALGDRVWELPPLILHPFSNQGGPGQLLDGYKAALMLAGLLPGEGEVQDELKKRLLLSRYAEIRMLYFVGKDLMRWIGQCVELVDRTAEFAGMDVREQSFAALLAYHPPEAVIQKLRQWGVASPESVFSRAMGLAALFLEVPPAEQLTEHFLLHYHAFADHLFACAQGLMKFAEITPSNFSFDLYASGEYTRMLEKQWEE